MLKLKNILFKDGELNTDKLNTNLVMGLALLIAISLTLWIMFVDTVGKWPLFDGLFFFLMLTLVLAFLIFLAIEVLTMIILWLVPSINNIVSRFKN